MKPNGTIPLDYQAEDFMLLVGGERIDALIERAGDTPLFVYDANMLRARAARLRAAMPADLAIHYAVKANPFAPVVELMAGLVDGLDVASAGEMVLALGAGGEAGAMSFAGPGKRDRELVAGIRAGVTINLESAGEGDRALVIAERIGIVPRLAVRVNPSFDLRGSGMRMGGGAKPFGIDDVEAGALIRRLIAAGADWRGLHIFAGSQALDPSAIAETQAATVALAARLADEAGAVPPLVNLGGGFGIPYFPGEVPLDIERIGVELAQTLERRPEILAQSRFAIELGRWLVG